MVRMIFLLLFSYIPKTLQTGIEAYDCTNTKNLSLVQSYDLSEVEKCPTFPKWFPAKKEVNVQLLYLPRKAKMNVRICQVKTSSFLNYCNYVGQSLAYGTTTQLDVNVPYQMPAEDCLLLLDHKQLKYKWEEIVPVGNETHFTQQFLERGASDTVEGTCSGVKFVDNGITYYHHVKRVVLEVTTWNETREYNTREKTLVFNKKTIPLTDLSYSNGENTYVWSQPQSTCSEGGVLHKFYEGKGIIYSTNDTEDIDQTYVRPMLMIKDDSRNMSYGLQLNEDDFKCQNNVISTQSQELFIKIKDSQSEDRNQDWIIQDLPQIDPKDLNLLDRLKITIGYEFISYNKKISNSVTEIAKKVCNQEKQVSLTKIAVLRKNTEEGIFTLFGPGHHGLIRGAAVHVFKCPSVNVTFLKDLSENTQDFPIEYINSEGKMVQGFLDSTTRKIQHTTIEVEGNENFQTWWKLTEKHWWCTRGGLGHYCTSTPKKIPVDYSTLVQEISMPKDYTFGSGIQKDQTDDKLVGIIHEDVNVKNKVHEATQKINHHDDEESLLEYLKQSGISKGLSSVNTSEITVWNIIVYGVMAAIGMYTYYMFLRIHRWYDSPKEYRTKEYLIKAIFCPHQFTETFNSRRYQKARKKMDDAKDNQSMVVKPELTLIESSHIVDMNDSN